MAVVVGCSASCQTLPALIAEGALPRSRRIRRVSAQTRRQRDSAGIVTAGRPTRRSRLHERGNGRR
jgi:hypothetical protein